MSFSGRGLRLSSYVSEQKTFTPFREFSGALYARPGVHVHRAEARAFIQASAEAWDIIDVSLVDSFAAAAAGVSAVGENYLYTREALEVFLRHLRTQGLLSVTRWVRMPPRDELKLFATAVAALERMGLNPAERLVLLRSWATATLLVKKEPFSADEITALRRWAAERLFDTAYFPGIAPGESNRFNVLERDDYADDPRFTKDYLAYVQADEIVTALVVPIEIGRRVLEILRQACEAHPPARKRPRLTAEHARSQILHETSVLHKETAVGALGSGDHSFHEGRANPMASHRGGKQLPQLPEQD